MDKSFVGIVYKHCMACQKVHDEFMVIDEKLRDRFEMKNHILEGLCPDCEEKIKKGYQILVEVTNGDNLKNERAYRTGRFAYMKKEAIKEEYRKHDIVFVDKEFMDNLQENAK